MVGRLLFFVIVLFLFLILLYMNQYILREQALLRDKEYFDVVRDWERLQSWFVREQPGVVFPLMFSLSSGNSIMVDIDSDGKLVLPSGLSKTELTEIVGILKFHLGFPYNS